jgi:hypothetical protein
MGFSEALRHCFRAVFIPQYVDGISTNANSASAALNKWMKTFLPKECVVHGMRHAFRDRLRSVNTPTDMIDQLGGWSMRSVGASYGEGFSLIDCASYLNASDCNLRADHKAGSGTKTFCILQHEPPYGVV